MNNNPAIQLAAKEIGLILKDTSTEDWINQFAEKVNDLLVNDFNNLVSILYRMDVSEKKVKQLLKDNPAEDAGKIIASLIIERQAQKIKSRQEFTKRENDIDEDEKW